MKMISSGDSSVATEKAMLLSIQPLATTALEMPVGRPSGGRLSAKRQPQVIAPRQLEAAVYAHIRALRALGRTTVNSSEIANALNLSLRDVEAAFSTLATKGVKIIK